MVIDNVKDREPIQNELVKGEKRFNSFGEQLMAVYRAASPDGKVDSRLTTRAALRLNESVPSDGGFLVQKDFVSELLKRTYEIGMYGF